MARRRNRNRRANGMMTTQRVSARMGNTMPGRAVITGRTVILPVSQTGGFGGNVVSCVDPTAIRSSMLSFSRYRVLSYSIEYVPTTTNTSATGSIAIGVLTDAADAAAFAGSSAKWTSLINGSGRVTPVYRGLTYRVQPMEGLNEWKFVYNSDSGDVSIRRNTIPFWVAYGATGGIDGGSGFLVASYTIELEGTVSPNLNP